MFRQSYRKLITCQVLLMVTTVRKPKDPVLLISDFVNTAILGMGASEEFSTPARLRRWLISHDLIEKTQTVSNANLKRVIAFREALRNFLVRKGTRKVDPHTLHLLHDAAERAKFSLTLSPTADAFLQPMAKGTDGALGCLLSMVYQTMCDGSWVQLRACRSDTCRMAYVDRSKNGSRIWCEMAICGNRMKARWFRQRRAKAKR